MKPTVTQHLPDISIQDSIQESLDHYIHLEEGFNPFDQITDNSEKQISFASVTKRLNLPQEQPIAIISHLLDYPSTEHRHDYIEMIFLLNGTVVNIINRTPYLMEAGNLAIIPAHTPHLLAPHPDSQEVSQVVNLLIREDFFSAYLTPTMTDYEFLTQLPALTFSKEEQERDQVIHHLILEYKKADFKCNMAVLGCLLILFQRLKDSFQTQRSSYDELTKHVLDFIQSKQGLCHLTDLSQQLAYSEAHLSRHIKKQTGKTVAEWITQAKLTKAQTLLLESDLTISQIALQVGYQSESHFFRVFKQAFSMTPRQYQILMT